MRKPRDTGVLRHPYDSLPPRAFWRTGVAEADPFDARDLVRPKFRLPRDAAIATAGSCFAQHVGRALREGGLNVLDAEPAPPQMSPDRARDHGFGLYTARYGNIYTTRQMRQLVEDALADRVDPDQVWQDGEVFVDALRPTLERHATARDVLAARRLHLGAVRGGLGAASHLILTLGLTEVWQDRTTGRVWPLCPGVKGGRFDPARHEFVRLGWPDLVEDLAAIRRDLRRLNPTLRIILTVSPVPLTATGSGDHVLVASTRSKATLRAAAGDFADLHDDVDYFPAYEIATHPAARGMFFAPNLREIRPQGVATVMGAFMAAHRLARAPGRPSSATRGAGETGDEVACDERLLEAYADAGKARAPAGAGAPGRTNGLADESSA